MLSAAFNGRPKEQEALNALELKPSLLVKSSQVKKVAPKVTETKALVMQEREMTEKLSEKKH